MHLLPTLLVPRTEEAERDVDAGINNRPGGSNPRLSSFVSCLKVYRSQSSPFFKSCLLSGPLDREAVQLSPPCASIHTSRSCADYGISTQAGHAAETARRDRTARHLGTSSVQGTDACAAPMCVDEMNHKQTWFLAVVDLGQDYVLACMMVLSAMSSI